VSTRPTQFDREEREVEFSRALAFSDGVFAFAVTLLVTGLDIPKDLHGPDLNHQLWEAIRGLGPNFLSYGISFAVIGLMWLHHHRLLSRFRALDATALWLNLLSLSFIVLMPFSTNVLGEYGETPVAVAVYALNIAAATSAYTLLWYYGLRRGMLGEALTPRGVRVELLSRGMIVGGFLLSIPIAYVDTTFAKWFWLISGFVQARVQGRLVKRGSVPTDA
jgi:uncharacterized membrane protein